jgi:hypothetical protein
MQHKFYGRLGGPLPHRLRRNTMERRGTRDTSLESVLDLFDLYGLLKDHDF